MSGMDPIDGEEHDEDVDTDPMPIGWDPEAAHDNRRTWDVEREDFLGIDGSGPDGE